jgi:hypothetical protein
MSKGDFDTLVVTKNFKERTNPIVKNLYTGKVPNAQPKIKVSCIKTDGLADRKLMRWGVLVKKINYYEIMEENKTPTYMAIYFTAENKIADISY